MSFDDDEDSEQDGSTREYFDIVLGASEYHVTSGTGSFMVGSTVYTAESVDRGEGEVTQLSTQTDGVLEVTLRADHPAVRRWFQSAIPPSVRRITAYTLQERSGESEQFWSGRIVSASASGDGGTVTFRVSSLLGEPVRKHLPVITAGVQCGHVLYDEGCRVSRAGADPDAVPFKCTTTVIAVSGRDVRLDLSNVPADHSRRSYWLRFGELVVTGGAAATDRRTIRSQDDLNPGVSTVTVVSLSRPIPNLKIGDAVETYVGCEHDIFDCHDRFRAKHNYGGLPYMTPTNPYRAPQTGPKK